MLTQLCKSKFFTSLDLGSAYDHINLSPETGHKSTFTVIFGNYEFFRMLFRLVQVSA